jgi:hypothetical protein
MTGPEAADAVEIQLLLNRFLHAADRGTPEDVAACFTERGQWQVGAASWTGRAEIAAGISDMRSKGFAGPGTGTRHLGSNLRLELAGDGATAHSCFTFLTTGAAAIEIRAVGTYVDVLARTPEGWRISSRSIEP